jgi:hypothetical protein
MVSERGHYAARRSEMRTVAALCVAPKSIYHQIPGVECYDINRDCRTFPGGMPVVTHAPCRPWSAYTSHQAKFTQEEKDLGPWCVDQLLQNGGVFEHPAHSRLFDACGLPKPFNRTDGMKRGYRSPLWSMEVWQCWWGYPMRKATWLVFCGVDPKNVRLPFSLHPRGSDRRREQVMSHQQRSKTTRAFAEWLVEVARTAQV